MKPLKGIMFIGIACVVSTILSLSADMSHLELGAMINMVWPPFLSLLAIIIFLLVCWISKKDTVRKATVSILCIYLVYVGMALYFGKDWPLVIW